MTIQSQLDQVLALLDKAVHVNGWRFVESMKRVVEQSADRCPSDEPPTMARFEVWHRWRAELGYTTKEGYQPPEQVVISAEDAKTIADFIRQHGSALRAAVGGEAVVVAHRLHTPGGKWQWMNGMPSKQALEDSKNFGWEMEYAYASPTATVDVGALAELVEKWRLYAGDNELCALEADSIGLNESAKSHDNLAKALDKCADELAALIGKEA